MVGSGWQILQVVGPNVEPETLGSIKKVGPTPVSYRTTTALLSSLSFMSCVDRRRQVVFLVPPFDLSLFSSLMNLSLSLTREVLSQDWLG